MRYIFLSGTVIDLVLLEESDTQAVTHAINDHDMTQFLDRGDLPQTEEESREWLRTSSSNKNDLLFGICLKGQDEIIGTTGLHRISWRDQSTSLGITIYGEKNWGKGIGTEAVLLLTDHAFQRMNLRHIRLSVLGNNPRGQRCYKKCGFREIGRYPKALFKEGKWVDEILMLKSRE